MLRPRLALRRLFFYTYLLSRYIITLTYEV
jgi:hypothetical protein